MITENVKGKKDLILFHQAENKAHNGHDRKNEEQNFGNFNSASRNAAKTKDGCNQRND